MNVSATTVVPYFDLKAEYASLRDEVLAALDRVCRNASFILGEEVEVFEKQFAALCETNHCVALNSGTSALHLGMLALGVQHGDEVITTPNTFIATAEAISYCGARPVFVDIDPATANLDPKLIERAITRETKAIVPVHLYGRVADMDAILEIASRHRLGVLEDACQAHGARFRGRRAGSLGHAAAFSFYPTKISAPMAKAERSRPTTIASRSSLAPRAPTARPADTNTNSSDTTTEWKDFKARCCR